ncbi:MAG TPA: transposase [candidate division Zixibacteria bacterium]|nr:transposase [candidate division Zixibacteria bacterium]HEQ98829.1 transposase [candidate division Zixibacteria bacterium]
MPNGKWESHVKDRIDTIRAWKRSGLTDKEIAENLGIGYTTFRRYMKDHRTLWSALKTGKSDADALVENALFKRAMGYRYEEVEESVTKNKEGEITGTRTKRIKKQIAPDVTAIIFYLKNRKSQDWHDRHALEHSGPDGTPLNPPVIHAYMPPNGRELLPEESDVR